MWCWCESMEWGRRHHFIGCTMVVGRVTILNLGNKRSNEPSVTLGSLINKSYHNGAIFICVNHGNSCGNIQSTYWETSVNEQCLRCFSGSMLMWWISLRIGASGMEHSMDCRLDIPTQYIFIQKPDVLAQASREDSLRLHSPRTKVTLC